MGNSGGKNRTHPGEDGPSPVLMDPMYGDIYDKDQHRDYDSGWYRDKTYGESYRDDGNNPIKKKRSCTDVICLLLFIAFLGGWGVVAFFGIQGGDIDKVIYPTNSQGEVCGRGEQKDRPYLLMFDLTQCLNAAALVTGCPTEQICVQQCPQESYSPSAARLAGENEEKIKQKMKPYCKPHDDSKTLDQLLEEEICPKWYVESNALVGRCFPFLSSVTGRSGEQENNTVVVKNGEKDVTKGELKNAINRLEIFLFFRQTGEKVFADLQQTYWMIGLALIGACLLSFIWIILMRYITGVMVWGSILIVFLGTGGALGYCGYRLYFAYLDDDPRAQEKFFQLNITPEIVKDFLKQSDTWLAFTVILGILFLVIICLFIFLRKRIQIAIALIEEGSKAVGTMFSSLFFPIIPYLFQLLVVFWFLVVALFLASSGKQEYRVAFRGDSQTSAPCNCFHDTKVVNTTQNATCLPEEFQSCTTGCPGVVCQFVKYKDNSDYSLFSFFNVFGLYWGVFFFGAFGEMVLAGVFSQWYWTLDKKKNLPRCALGTSLWNATVFHLGTVAFGSLVIAIIRMIRTILEYVEKKLKKFNNDLTKCLLCACKCCLWCLEKFMRFINRNAYIMCAIKNTNFCKSAYSAFNLIMRNLVRVVVLDSVVDFLLFLGKLVIVLITGSVSYLAFAGHFPDIKDEIPSLNYFVTPVVLIVIGSYFIASSFFGVYAMAVDTLFLCFLEDLERNDGSQQRPFYMSKSLKKILGKMEETAAEARFRSPQ